VLLVGAAVVVVPWYAAMQWQGSPEAARAERNADAPTPIWLAPTAVGVSGEIVSAGSSQPTNPEPQLAAPTLPIAAQPVPAATPQPTVVAPPQLSTPIALNANIAVRPTATPAISDLKLTDSAFTFDDPPQPGAHVHLTLTVHNPTEVDSGAVSVNLPTTWLPGYKLESTEPSIVDGSQASGMLRLRFDGPAAGDDLNVSLGFVTTDEVIDSPNLSVVDADGRQVGKAHPPTQAPPPRPGPIYSIDIPSLRLHTGVVPVDWEPPLFVVGQLRTSANVTLGNSVLVGHVRGAAGYNVFDHLDQVQVGDQIVASSRGATYNFVVTDKQELPEDDTSPTDSTDTARLTLMTCAGTWNPVAQDYPDRLWVVAEPPDAVQPTDAAGSAEEATSSNTRTPQPTDATTTPTRTQTPRPTGTTTATPTMTMTQTPQPTDSATPTVTQTPQPTDSATPTVTQTPQPTNATTPTRTQTP
jgi:LPXTG-site transpeptidase (sortase) family protein